MLICQSPLRVSLLGGGSDLPSFLEHNEGAVLSFAINRRVFIIGHQFTHRTGILLRYSQTEDVTHPPLLKHPIARVVLQRYGINDIDLVVMSDVPAGTGLGSSSSFTVALLGFVRHMCQVPTTAEDLAREACEIEIDTLKEPIGYQDQWASAIGGLNILRFSGREVSVESMSLELADKNRLESNLHLVPAGKPRSASELLAKQSEATRPGQQAEKLTQNLVSLVSQGQRALQSNLDDLGPLLNEAWMLKRQITSGVSNELIDGIYEQGLSAGATGGKLLGAGGSGYIAFYVPEISRHEFNQAFPQQLDFSISEEGAGVIHES